LGSERRGVGRSKKRNLTALHTSTLMHLPFFPQPPRPPIGRYKQDKHVELAACRSRNRKQEGKAEARQPLPHHPPPHHHPPPAPLIEDEDDDPQAAAAALAMLLRGAAKGMAAGVDAEGEAAAAEREKQEEEEEEEEEGNVEREVAVGEGVGGREDEEEEKDEENVAVDGKACL